MTQHDDDVKKAFLELQDRLLDYRKQFSQVSFQSQQKTQQMRLSQITQRELKECGEHVCVYRSVGHMYLAVNPIQLVNELTSQENEAKDALGTLNRSQIYLKERLSETERALKELVVKEQEATS